MNNKLRFRDLLCLICLQFACILPAFAVDSATSEQDPLVSPTPSSIEAANKAVEQPDTTPVEDRQIKENVIPPNFFTINFYKPNYVLPFYYTGSPYGRIYEGATPQNESIKNTEIKYQLSLKVPIWKNMFHSSSSIFLAYTQQSYWQAYNKYAFFRETDYEPEIFLTNEIDFFHFNALNFGVEHQSNGFGNNLERSWNRAYFEAVASLGDWMFSIKPWTVFQDNTYRRMNPDMAKYLGHGQLLVSYKFGNQVFALQAHNLIEGGSRYATGEFTWSFPVTNYLNGYIDVFSGYGQSLIEYNHHTNSAGIGISFSNWV